MGHAFLPQLLSRRQRAASAALKTRVNSVALIGRLAREPQLQSLRGGMAVCRLTVAVARRDLVEPASRDAAVLVDVLSLDKYGEACAARLAKGSRVAILGKLDHAPDAAPGHPGSHEVIATTVECLDGPAGRRTARVPT
jgi:hypothetical protein